MKRHDSVGVIEVRLRDVSQLFNSMDPSPFLLKDLDQDAEEFIVSWARELHGHREVRLVVHLEKVSSETDAQAVVTEAVHHFFAERAELSRRELKRVLRMGRTSLVIGLFFLATLLAGARLVAMREETTAMWILKEGLIIGGWVAMWRPLELLLYSWWPVAEDVRLLRRLSRMDVVVRPVSQS